MTTINITDQDFDELKTLFDDLKSLSIKKPILARLIQAIEFAVIRDQERAEFNRLFNARDYYRIIVKGVEMTLTEAVRDPEINKHGVSYQTIYNRLRRCPGLSWARLFGKIENGD